MGNIFVFVFLRIVTVLNYCPFFSVGGAFLSSTKMRWCPNWVLIGPCTSPIALDSSKQTASNSATMLPGPNSPSEPPCFPEGHFEDLDACSEKRVLTSPEPFSISPWYYQMYKVNAMKHVNQNTVIYIPPEVIILKIFFFKRKTEGRRKGEQ